MTIPTPDQPLPTGADKVASVRTMFDTIAPRYDLVNRLMTFGLDQRWRSKAISALSLEPGSTVADLACGTGDFAKSLAKRGYRPIGFDLAFEMLKHARSDSPRVQADCLSLPLPSASVDAVTCGFALRNLVELKAFFVEMARIVKPGGQIALLDVSKPDSTVLSWGYDIYFGRIVPRIGALLSDANAYHYLPRSLSYLPSPSDMVQALQNSGFIDVVHAQLDGGLVQLLTASRSAAAHIPNSADSA